MFTGRTIVVDKVFCQFKVDGDELHESDIIWMFDMIKELGVEHHNMETCVPQDIPDSSEMVFNAHRIRRINYLEQMFYSE